jgi:hypothetical protein
VFRLRCRRFSGTISGLRDGELGLSSLEAHIKSVVAGIHRGGETLSIVDFGMAKEVHKNSAHPEYKSHFHFILSLSNRLDHSSTHFDPVGTSGAKLRCHIKIPEDDVHWANQIRYLLKEGNCVLQLSDATPIQPGPPVSKRARTGAEWAVVLQEACQEPGITPFEAVEKVQQEHFAEWVLHYDKLLQAATRILGMHQLAVRLALIINSRCRQSYTLDTFVSPWNQPFDFFVDHNGNHDARARRAIVISGVYAVLILINITKACD